MYCTLQSIHCSVPCNKFMVLYLAIHSLYCTLQSFFLDCTLQSIHWTVPCDQFIALYLEINSFYFTLQSINCTVHCNKYMYIVLVLHLAINSLYCTLQSIHFNKPWNQLIELYLAIYSLYYTSIPCDQFIVPYLRLIHCTVPCNISILFYLTIGEDRPRFEASPTGNKESTLVLLIFKLSKNIRCIKINFKLF